MKYAQTSPQDLADILLQDTVELKHLLESKECLLKVFNALNTLNPQDLEYITGEVEGELAGSVLDVLQQWDVAASSSMSLNEGSTDTETSIVNTKAMEHQQLFIESMRLMCKTYSFLSSMRNSVRSAILPHVFVKTKTNSSGNQPHLIIQIMAIKFLARVFLVHKDDMDINNLLAEYIKFIETHIEDGNITVITALINIIPEIVQHYLRDIISLLVRLASSFSSSQSKTTKPIIKLREKSIKKSVKNVLCSVLKANNFDENSSFGIMDCLIKQLNVSKSDSYQLSQILSTRGLNYQNSATQLQLTNEQISTAIVAALQHYANTNHPNQPTFILPPDANLSIHVVVEIIISALQSFNPKMHADNGLQHWSQIIASIQHFTQQALQIQIQHLSQVASVMDTSHSAVTNNKFIAQTQPYNLASVNISDIDSHIELILQSGLEELANGSASQNDDVESNRIVDFDGSLALFDREKRKRKLESMEDDEMDMKESRAYKSTLIGRLFAHPVFDKHRDLIVNWALNDFSRRWDVCVRWLWESSYLDYIQEEKDSHNLYESNLFFLIERMFELAENTVPGMDSTYIPWLVNHGQSLLFRRFLSCIPRIPKKGILLDILKKYSSTELTVPMPTPLEKLKFQMALETYFDLITWKPSIRFEMLSNLLSNVFSNNAVKRTECIKVIKNWWTAESDKPVDFGYIDGVFKPLFGTLESFGLTLVKSLKDDNFSTVNLLDSNEQTRRLIETSLKYSGYMFEKGWTIDLVNSILEFSFALVVKNPYLFSEVVKCVCNVRNELVSNAIVESTANFLISNGAPRDDNDFSFKLLSQVGLMIFDSEKTQSLMLHVCKILTSYPPDISIKQPFSTPPKALSKLIVDILKSEQGHLLSVDFWGCIIGSDSLSRSETYLAIYCLTKRFVDESNPDNHDLYVYIVSEILKPPSLLSPVEFLIFLNNLCDLAPFATSNDSGNSHSYEYLPRYVLSKYGPLSIDKCSSALNLVINHPHSSFAMRTVSAAISLMMSNYSTGASYPILFMNTVLNFLLKFKTESYGFVLSQVLAPCCNLRMMWNAAKERSFSKSNEEHAAKMLWKYFVQCLSECAPNSFVLVIQLQKDRLSLVLDNLGEEYLKSFWSWCMNERTGIRGKKVQVAIEIMNSKRVHK